MTCPLARTSKICFSTADASASWPRSRCTSDSSASALTVSGWSGPHVLVGGVLDVRAGQGAGVWGSNDGLGVVGSSRPAQEGAQGQGLGARSQALPRGLKQSTGLQEQELRVLPCGPHRAHFAILPRRPPRPALTLASAYSHFAILLVRLTIICSPASSRSRRSHMRAWGGRGRGVAVRAAQTSLIQVLTRDIAWELPARCQPAHLPNRRVSSTRPLGDIPYRPLANRLPGRQLQPNLPSAQVPHPQVL